MKNSKVKWMFSGLMAVLLIAVLLVSCQQEEIIEETVDSIELRINQMLEDPIYTDFAGAREAVSVMAQNLNLSVEDLTRTDQLPTEIVPLVESLNETAYTFFSTYADVFEQSPEVLNAYLPQTSSIQLRGCNQQDIIRCMVNNYPQWGYTYCYWMHCTSSGF